MLVYRLGRTQFAKDIDGTGAKLFGGRWNHIDTPCIYTAESRALSVLEYSVNINIEFVPRALSLSVFEINDKYIKALYLEELPGNWQDAPAPSSTKDLGTELLHQGIAIIKVPSSVIKDEFNYLINPHAQGVTDHFRLVEVEDFVYDVRIKLK